MFKSFIKRNKQADSYYTHVQNLEATQHNDYMPAKKLISVETLAAEISSYNYSKDPTQLASIIEQLSDAIVAMLNCDVRVADIIYESKLIDISEEQEQVFLYDSKYYYFNPTTADEQLLCNLALRKLISLGIASQFFTFLVENINIYIKPCEHGALKSLATCGIGIEKQNMTCHFAKMRNSSFSEELALLKSQLHVAASCTDCLSGSVAYCAYTIGKYIGHEDIFFELLQLSNLKKVLSGTICTEHASEFPLVNVVRDNKQSILKQIDEILEIMKLAGARTTPLQRLSQLSCGYLLYETIYHTYLISHPVLLCALLLGASGVLENHPAQHLSVVRYFSTRPYAEAQFCAEAAELVYGELKNAKIEYQYDKAIRALLDSRDFISKMSSIQFMDYVLDLIEYISQNAYSYLVCYLIEALSVSFQAAQLAPNYLRFRVGYNSEQGLRQMIYAAQSKITDNLHVDEYNPAMMLQLMRDNQLHVLFYVDHNGFCRSDSYLCCNGIISQISVYLYNLQQSKLAMDTCAYQQLRMTFATTWNAILHKRVDLYYKLIPESEFRSIVYYKHVQQEAVILESLFYMLSQCCEKGKIGPGQWRQILQMTKCVIASGAVDESGSAFLEIANMPELDKATNIEEFVQEVYRKKLLVYLVYKLLSNQEKVEISYDRQSELRNMEQLKKFESLDFANVNIQEYEEAPVQMFDSAMNAKDQASANGIDSAINFDIPLITESASSTPAIASSQETQPSKLAYSYIQQSQVNDSLEVETYPRYDLERYEKVTTCAASEYPIQPVEQCVHSSAPAQDTVVPEYKLNESHTCYAYLYPIQPPAVKVDNVDLQNTYAAPVRTIEISDSSSDSEDEKQADDGVLQIEDQQNLEIIGEKPVHKIAVQPTEVQQSNDFQVEEYAYPGYLENRLPFVNNNILVDEVDVEAKLALFDQNTDTILSEVIPDFYVLAESEVSLILTKEAGRSSFATPLPCVIPLSMKSKQAQFKENWAEPATQRQLSYMKTYIERVNKNYAVKYPSLCKWNDVVLSKQNKGRICADCGCELQFVSEVKDFEDVDLSDDIEMKVLNYPVFCQYEGHWLCHKCSGGHAGYLGLNPDNMDGKQVVVSARALGELYKYWYSRCYTPDYLKGMLQRDAQQAMSYQKAIQSCQACVDTCKKFTLTARRLVLRNESELFEDELTMQEVLSNTFKNIWLKGDYEGFEKFYQIQDDCAKVITKAGGCFLFDRPETEMGSITERKMQLLRVIFAHATQCPYCRQAFFLCPDCKQPMNLEDDESVIKFAIDFCCEHGLKECPSKRHRLLKHKCLKK